VKYQGNHHPRRASAGGGVLEITFGRIALIRAAMVIADGRPGAGTPDEIKSNLD